MQGYRCLVQTEAWGNWSARPEILLMPKTNFGSGVTEDAKPLLSPHVS